jgi:hypothetical protein
MNLLRTFGVLRVRSTVKDGTGKILSDQVREISPAEQERQRLAAEQRYQRTHPASAPQISGCCDRADQM